MTVMVSSTKDKILLSFPYNQISKGGVFLREQIRPALGGSWVASLKAWLVTPTDETKTALEELCDPTYCGESTKILSQIKSAANRVIQPLPKNKFKRLGRKPMGHQWDAWEFIDGLNTWALLMEMGTGKTKVMLDAMFKAWVDKRIKGVIVLCPKSIVFNQFLELTKDKWAGVTVNEYRAEGDSKSKVRALMAMLVDLDLPVSDDRFHFTAVNYDSLINPQVEGVLADILEHHEMALICDESTKIKNIQAKRTKAAIRIGQHAAIRGIMTGSPISESPVDIFGQYTFLDEKVFGPSFVAFRFRYCVLGGFEGKEIIGFKNLDKFQKHLFTKAFRVTKEECLDLPPKIYETRVFDMPDDMAAQHGDMAALMVTELENEKFTVANAITKFLRLQEITSGYLKDGERIARMKSNPKMDLVDEILDESSAKKVVIWCREIEEIRIVVELLKARKDVAVFQLHGAVKDREEQVTGFRTYPKRAVMVSNPQTGGMGLTLVEATLVIYFSNLFSEELRSQSEDRTHRTGQKHSVTYVDLLGKDSIDCYVHEVLMKKRKRARDITDVKTALQTFRKGHKRK